MKNIPTLEEFLNENEVNESIKLTKITSSIKARKFQLQLNKDIFELSKEDAEDIKDKIEAYLKIF